LEEFTASDLLLFQSWRTADGFRLSGSGIVDDIVDVTTRGSGFGINNVFGGTVLGSSRGWVVY
jgi:hypothetical protein